jgi:hypothetical protein
MKKKRLHVIVVKNPDHWVWYYGMTEKEQSRDGEDVPVYVVEPSIHGYKLVGQPLYISKEHARIVKK